MPTKRRRLRKRRRKKRLLFGLISYQPRWGLSIRGWLVILLAIALGFYLMLFKLQPFLAYSAPVEAEILVVEGWIGDDGVIGAIAEFERKPYRLLITTGIYLDRGEYLSEYKNFAHLTEATLITLGFDPQNIQPVPTPTAKRDRTLTSAVAVKNWLTKSKLNPQGINVYTDDAHSRRSWLLYKKVLEPEIEVGIIAHPPTKYDAKTWWTSSQGFRTVLSEGLAYIYAKFL